MSLLKIFNILSYKLIEDSKSKKIDNEYIYIWDYLFHNVKSELTKMPVNKFTISQKPISIILTMTTCKRFPLFQQTVNSILNTWNDIQLIDYWFVVDDNSHNEDRQNMLSLYPFIDYYMKNNDEKGHIKSMNIIYDKLFNSTDIKYWIHIEDDFLFFYPTNYINKAINGLDELKHFNVKQIMFNRNYIQTFDEINMPGHINYSDNINYSLHNYHPNGKGCKYWANFSFRPSLIDVNAILSLGNFNSNEVFFEAEYANKYTEAGYKTAFLNTITNIHIGRLVNNSGENAYSLNNVSQFHNDDIINEIKVINLKRRPDRKEKIISFLEKENLPYKIIEAVDGRELNEKDKLLEMFVGNDFNSRKGMIGCALSHYKLWKELTESNDQYWIIMEDDAVLCKNFKKIILNNIKKIKFNDIIFFGYLMTNTNKQKNIDKYYNNLGIIDIQPIDKDLFIGGTHCYSITKKAAFLLLDFIDMHGIQYGIDFLMVKIQEIVPVYESIPHIAFAEWDECRNQNIDSDIQYDYDNFNITSPDEFVFIKKMDQNGYDIKYITNNIITNLKREANLNNNCVAFNSLGFLKSNVIELDESIYYNENDGIYIKKDFYENVYLKKK